MGVGVAVAAVAGSVMGAWGADAGPGVGVVGTVEAWRIAGREKAAPALVLHCDEAIVLRGEARVEARGRVRDESCGVVSGAGSTAHARGQIHCGIVADRVWARCL